MINKIDISFPRVEIFCYNNDNKEAICDTSIPMFYCALFSKLIPLDDPDIYDKSTFYVVRIEI